MTQLPGAVGAEVEEDDRVTVLDANALATERIVTIVTISLIGVVAALNILITLIMMVMEKNRDIAVLMSMGAKRQQIRAIFMFQGLLNGVVGTVIGLALGYGFSAHL